MKQRFFRHLAALLLPLCLLAGCARTPDLTPVWQDTLPGSGAGITLANCTLIDNADANYVFSREDKTWQTRPALYTTPSPVLTLTGVTADQVELRFAEQIADLYLWYDKVLPQEKLDYIFTETADGALQYQLDTITAYELIVTTDAGTDDFLILCQQPEA